MDKTWGNDMQTGYKGFIGVYVGNKDLREEKSDLYWHFCLVLVSLALRAAGGDMGGCQNYGPFLDP